MLQHNKYGFAVVEALLIVVILTIVAGTGYFVWHAKQNADISLNNAKNSQQEIVKATKVTDFATCKAASGSKLLETYPEQCVTKDGKSFTDTGKASTTTNQQKIAKIENWTIASPSLQAALLSSFYDKAVQTCYTPAGQNSQYVIKVDKMVRNDFATVGYFGCGGTVVLANVDGTWKQVASLAQAPSCKVVNQYKISQEIVSSCYPEGSQQTIQVTYP